MEEENWINKVVLLPLKGTCTAPPLPPPPLEIIVNILFDVLVTGVRSGPRAAGDCEDPSSRVWLQNEVLPRLGQRRALPGWLYTTPETDTDLLQIKQ